MAEEKQRRRVGRRPDPTKPKRGKAAMVYLTVGELELLARCVRADGHRENSTYLRTLMMSRARELGFDTSAFEEPPPPPTVLGGGNGGNSEPPAASVSSAQVALIVEEVMRRLKPR